MKNTICLLFVLLLNIKTYAQIDKPYGLMTDLLEHTDKVWQNGYISNIPIREINSHDDFQFAEIRSSYPYFSWIVPGEGHDIKQVSYRIIVDDTYEKSINSEGAVWDSGEIESNKSTSVAYTGPALQPDKTYFWRVKSKTGNSENNWSDIKAFRTASELSEYSAGYYPLVKTIENPKTVNSVASDSYTADFGKAAFAQLTITLTSESDSDTVRVHMGELLSGNRVNRNPGGTIRYSLYTLPLIKGTHTYKIKITPDTRNTGPDAVLMPPYIGEVLPFRYCEIEGYSNTLAKENIIRESVYYPFNESASYFSCSNDTLNQIWDLCKYSIKATSFTGIYIDGDRERIAYEADALINQLCHYSVDREYSMARISHEYLLQHPTWPTEWIIQAVLIAWYDYLYTGDNRSLKANYDILKARTLIQLKNENGLISTKTGGQTPEFKKSIRFNGNIRDIVDWPHPGEIDGFVFSDYNTVVNAFHYEALKLMEKIAGVLNLKDDELYFKKETEQLKKDFNKLFFNKKTGRYVDGISEEHASLHSNMFPVAFDMVPANRLNTVMDFIKSRGMACSVYGSQFLSDALYDKGYDEYALKMLTKNDDRGWYNMIRAGSTITLEAWDNKYKPNQDWNHPWGAAPANIIPRKLMGIEPLVPGYGSVRIKPQTASLAWAKIIVPTIKGSISANIQNNNGEYILEVEIPANMEAEVFLPLLFNKYNITNNGVPIKTEQLKSENFIYIGKYTSGTYRFVMKKIK